MYLGQSMIAQAVFACTLVVCARHANNATAVSSGSSRCSSPHAVCLTTVVHAHTVKLPLYVSCMTTITPLLLNIPAPTA